MNLRSSSDLLRDRTSDGSGRVAFVELFFDLVFVFAITQLSHLLLYHFTPLGAVQTGLLMLAVWWVWIYTTWVPNWLDPQKLPVRLMLYALMLLGLFMSMAIPAAFEARGLVFALAFVAMQVGRCLFALWALAGRAPVRHRNFQRITAWLAFSGLFWIAGAFLGPEARLAVWFVALAIEYLGPWLGFWTPGLGRSATTDWDVDGGHIAERCGLFVIICLGETLLISGATFADVEAWDAPGLGAFLVGFVGTVAMWWIYFNVGHERATHLIERSDDPGRIARIAFTYAHIPIVAGVVLNAVASELVVAHPEGNVAAGDVAAIVGGPAVFLAGNLWFKSLTARLPPLSHMVGLGLLALCAAASGLTSPLGLGAATTAVLIVVAIWERVSLGPRPAPSLGTEP
jgi:low temperature requirement protein LtrA